MAAVLVYYVTDILWGIIESRKLAQLLFIDTSVYFVAMAAGVLFWTQYAVRYLEERSAFGRFLILAGRILAAATALLTVVNLFVPVLFTVDDDCVYRSLGVRYGVLAVQILLLLMISVYTLSAFLRNRTEQRLRYRTLALFGLIMAICLGAQIRFPYLPLYAIAYLLGTCLLRAFVIGDEKEAYRHKLEETERIRELQQSILDVNDLKTVNDSAGHQAGDQYLRDAGAVICDVFKHSPVFRIGGDEFAVIAEGKDYACIEELLGRVYDHNTDAIRSGGVVSACGMARFENDESVAAVFARADACMYENKLRLKAEQKAE